MTATKRIRESAKRTPRSPDTKKRLLEAASVEFALRGYEGAMLQTIARQVGIRAASVFHHFPGGKRQIFEEVFAGIFQSLSALVSAGISIEDSSLTVLPQMVEQFWDYCEQHPAFVALLLREMLNPDSEKLQIFHDSNVQLLALAAEFIEQGQKRGEIARFDPHYFIYWAATTCICYHGAPGLRDHFWPSLPVEAKSAHLRKVFLDSVRQRIAR